MGKKLVNRFAPVLVVIILLVVWQFACIVFHISFNLLPKPTEIGSALIHKFSEVIFPDMLVSLQVMLTGYMIAVPVGFLIAAISSQFKFIVRMLTPLLVVLMVTPMVTLVPEFKLFFGVGAGVKVLAVVLQCAPVIAVNSITGFTQVPQNKLDVMKRLGCGRLETFIRVVIPNAMPQVFTGLKLGTLLCTIAATGADLSVGQGGLGYRIKMAASLSATDTAFATIVVVAVLGILLYYIVAKIETLVVNWK